MTNAVAAAICWSLLGLTGAVTLAGLRALDHRASARAENRRMRRAIAARDYRRWREHTAAEAWHFDQWEKELTRRG